MANVNLQATINVPLQVSDVTAVETVENSVEVVQTRTSSNVGTVGEHRTVESLPIVGTCGRNPLNLFNLPRYVIKTFGNRIISER